jgi:MoaE-MoaD fusion protein
MIVTVHLFASAREIAGKASIEVTLSDAAQISELKAVISSEYPSLANIVSRSQIARNQEFTTNDERVYASDELAIIPPVSGG